MTRAFVSLAAALALVVSAGCTDLGLEMPDFKGDSSADAGGVYHRPAARTTTPVPKSGGAVASTDARPPAPRDATGTGWTEGPDEAPPPVFAATPDDPRPVVPDYSPAVSYTHLTLPTKRIV